MMASQNLRLLLAVLLLARGIPSFPEDLARGTPIRLMEPIHLSLLDGSTVVF
jgi:hypothetical protein